MTYDRTPAKEAIAAPMGGFQDEWIRACKGDLQTTCNFDCSGPMTEQRALALVADRAGKKIEYDGNTRRVTKAPEANAFLRREYRAGWPLST
jgi:hypothetical protein